MTGGIVLLKVSSYLAQRLARNQTDLRRFLDGERRVGSAVTNLVSHTQQIPQDIGCDAGQANQDGTVADIVVGHVVTVRSGCEQFGAIIEADPNGLR